MNKIWLVIKHEYLKHVRKRRFILAILSLPIFIIFMIGIGFISGISQYNSAPVGFIDHSKLLSGATEYNAKPPISFLKPIVFKAFSDENDAKIALNQNEIQAYYVLEEDYFQTQKIQVVANKKPDSDVNKAFLTFLETSVLKDVPAKISSRIIEGASFEFKSTKENKQTNEDNILDFILPFISGFLFIMAVNISGSYLLQAVVEEKENRTMEIMVTSTSPTQLMTGKIIGNLSVGLTQLIVWILFGILGIAILFQLFPDLQKTHIDLSFLILTIAVFLPAFVMISAMMATLGATMTEEREAQQMAGIFSLPMVIPFWFIQVLMEKPNSPLSIFLSIFPFTAPISLPVRATFANIPLWQILLTILILILLTIASLWLAGKSFRLGMLRYGKKLSLKEIFTQRP